MLEGLSNKFIFFFKQAFAEKKNLKLLFGIAAFSLVLTTLVISAKVGQLPFLNSITMSTEERADRVFTSEVDECNAAPKEERFSCYRAALEKRYQGDIPYDYDLRKELKFKSDDASYAVFGTNCHTFYHAYGDYLATHLKGEDLADPLLSCPSDCTSGCEMGLIKRLALASEFSTQRVKELFDQCLEDSVHQCSHEVGHVLHDKYVSSILKPLDDMSEKNYGLKYSQTYRYTTFTTPDLNAPFEECINIVPKEELNYCYTGIGHNLFLVSEFAHNNFQGELDDCMKVAKENRDICLGFLIFRIGINNAATEILSGRVEEGIKVCEEIIGRLAREDLKYHCYTGIGGGIGLFLDSQYDLTSDLSIDLEFELLEIATLCDQVDIKFIDNCYKGIFGTPFKNIYKNFKYKYPKLDEILGPLEKDNFMVVG